MISHSLFFHLISNNLTLLCKRWDDKRIIGCVMESVSWFLSLRWHYNYVPQDYAINCKDKTQPWDIKIPINPSFGSITSPGILSSIKCISYLYFLFRNAFIRLKIMPGEDKMERFLIIFFSLITCWTSLSVFILYGPADQRNRKCIFIYNYSLS